MKHKYILIFHNIWPGQAVIKLLVPLVETASAHLLMDMAKMTGCQPDFRTSLIGGERRAIMTHAGMRSRKKPQTAGGRYHMSGEQHSTRYIRQNLWFHSSYNVDVFVSMEKGTNRGEDPGDCNYVRNDKRLQQRFVTADWNQRRTMLPSAGWNAPQSPQHCYSCVHFDHTVLLICLKCC